MLLVKRLIALQGDWVTVPGTYEILQVCVIKRIIPIEWFVCVEPYLILQLIHLSDAAGAERTLLG